MVGKSNIVLLVATGDNPEFSSDQVIFWDDRSLSIARKVEFGEPILTLSYHN